MLCFCSPPSTSFLIPLPPPRTPAPSEHPPSSVSVAVFPDSSFHIRRAESMIRLSPLPIALRLVLQKPLTSPTTRKSSSILIIMPCQTFFCLFVLHPLRTRTTTISFHSLFFRLWSSLSFFLFLFFWSFIHSSMMIMIVGRGAKEVVKVFFYQNRFTRSLEGGEKKIR